ncbi:MAG: 30S ribosomal protein S17e [Methanosarcinales archaeon]
MGIKPSYIKSLANQLLNEKGDIFSNSFEDNKPLVTQYTNVQSKVIRNRIAGYIARKKKTGNIKIA